MTKLNIITRCSRLNFLDKIYESVFSESQFDVTWWILFDLNRIEPSPTDLVKYSRKHINLKFFYGVPGDMGHSYLNEIYSQIDSGYIYNLDDDNNLHEDFYSELYAIINETPGKIIAFNQYVGGKDFTGLDIRVAIPDNMKLTCVDFAQVAFDKCFTVDNTLVPDYYCADGVFIEQLYSKYPEKFVFCDKILSYYNYFTNLT